MLRASTQRCYPSGEVLCTSPEQTGHARFARVSKSSLHKAGCFDERTVSARQSRPWLRCHSMITSRQQRGFAALHYAQEAKRSPTTTTMDTRATGAPVRFRRPKCGAFRAKRAAQAAKLVGGQRHYLRDADEVAGARLHSRVREKALDLFAHERLLLEQRVRDAVECGAMLAQQPYGLGERVVGKARLLAVAQALRLLRERVVVRAHRPRRHDLGHPVLEDHRAGEAGHLLEIVRRAVRHASEYNLLCGTSTEIDLHQVDELFLRVQVPVLGGKVERVAERLRGRH